MPEFRQRLERFDVDGDDGVSDVGLAGIVIVEIDDILAHCRGAGLTILSFWRFAIATLVGIAPTTFLPAHFGGEMATGESSRIMCPVLALGGITLIPVAEKIIRDRMRRPPT